MRVDVLARSGASPVPGLVDVYAAADPGAPKIGTLARDAAFGNLLVGTLTTDALPTPTGQIAMFVEQQSISDLWLAVTWSGAQ